MQNTSVRIRHAVAAVGVRPLVGKLSKRTGIAASVVLATRNRATYLNLTLAALERQIIPSHVWEVVVIDDASNDETPKMLDGIQRQQRLNLVWRRSSQRYGRAASRNEALALAKGQIVIFLNDDRLVGSDFLLRHLLHHLNEPCVVLGDSHRYIHTHIYPPQEPIMAGIAPKPIFESIDWNHPEQWRDLVLNDAKNYLPVFAFFSKEKVLPPYPWYYFSAGNASVPREQIMAGGCFDTSFCGLNLEETDLAYRLNRDGLRFHFEPRAYTLHQIHPRKSPRTDDAARVLHMFFCKYPGLDSMERQLILRSNT